MIRVIVFLLCVAAAAVGCAWLADQSGDVTLVWQGWRITTSLPVFAFGLLGLICVAAAIVMGLAAMWRTPARLRHHRHQRRQARARQAITHGLLAIGHGDADAARRHADAAHRVATQDPLTLLLRAQSAQLDGDREGARRAFHAMAERADTRLLGLRGLFIEAQRRDDPLQAVAIAEEALKLSPTSSWASHAVLGFRCARGDWPGALAILDQGLASGLLDKALWRRQRGVLLTARALELEHHDRDLSRESAMDAVKLAPTLVPAAALAAKFLSEGQQIRRAMRILEAAWVANPHPDLAEAYAHVRLGDSARQRLGRIESLVARTPGDTEGALALARAAIDAGDFARARVALAGLIDDPTQRVAMLMAEIERGDSGDDGKVREWMVRAVRARPDPAWTADGYVSDRWRPVSPVTGQIDAFQWQTPVAALGGHEQPAISAERAAAALDHSLGPVLLEKPVRDFVTEETRPAGDDIAGRVTPMSPQQPSPPIFRARRDLPVSAPAAVIPLVRAPDDPGVDDEIPESRAEADPEGQPRGWRGFLSRLSR